MRTKNSSAGADYRSNFKARGLGAFYDDGEWLASVELTSSDRYYSDPPPLDVPAKAYSAGFGRRFGKWTPFLAIHSYQEKSSNHAEYDPVGNRRTSLTLRYDLDANTAIKLQGDRNRDSRMNYGGDANVVRIAYDRMFF